MSTMSLIFVVFLGFIQMIWGHIGDYHCFTKIEKIARGFVWGSLDSNKKMSLVNWGDCYQPLSNGSLGL
ncbi:hypothetical protein EPI10_005784 [Gossypium australe]|uniref:Uncharacterized protein n=1 Tax=Gossypium australe TaxID=47621 RepID=A0A5B6WRT2_9ROSI|nr:hypothetical protein EPI10_005784 [Gossypium australe]